MHSIRVFLVALSLFLATFLATGPARSSDAIATEGIIDAPIAAVWNAWATTAGLRKWLAPHADIDLRIDGLMRSNYDPKGSLGDSNTIENRILAYEPERMLSIRVAKAPAEFPYRARVGEMWTVLYFQDAGEGKTRLRIVGLGFSDDAESQKMKDFFEQGNAHTLVQLQKAFAR